ncbi:GIN domain-containing protein [Mangrovivirga cuniculi]|uniref:Putative auto-transporter adhesin head GIN domain-containing protein n=1 Tax=Mangrovivirga cuniculi TaxID=2715131 RepID=A0A4D7K118_9BACT|nr:DUF2807 domain-containing protein [Mangrovivirga cuniculi]QCK14564.1 hypothetical protein DCC35_07320 [Mangrovivirga cuniculi]
MKKLIYILPILLFLAISCNDPDSFGCFKKAGGHAIEERPIGAFSNVIIETGVDIRFSDAQTETISIEGPENLLHKIETNINRDTLYIKDSNSCSWVRSPVRTMIHLPIPSDVKIYYRGYGNIELQTIEPINTFDLHIDDGMGDIYLNFATVGTVSVYNNSFSNVHLSGTADSLHFQYRNNFGQFEASALESRKVNMVYGGKNDVTINPTESITGVITGFGDVYSIQRPPVVDIEEISGGKLIFQD